MYEDWVELTLNLLEQTASISSPEDNEAALLEAFNDLETANAITQHFRVRFFFVLSCFINAYTIQDDHQCSAQIESK